MTDKKKKRQYDKPFHLDMSFEEMLARASQTDKSELEDEFAKIDKKQEELEEYVEERKDSIRRGARRSRKRFRL